LPLHNVFEKNVAIQCPRFLQMHGTVKETAVPRLAFRDNLVFGAVHAKDAETFPQDEAGRRRVTFMTEAMPNSADPDRNGFNLQDSETFRRLAPWFTRIPLERVGPNR
ncbi:MAG: hypothetical protein PHN34_11330, partial [Kiritimatiellae bacterium]|nr:hypothetical protein [Kiritimatiellia bacterium]